MTASETTISSTASFSSSASVAFSAAGGATAAGEDLSICEGLDCNGSSIGDCNGFVISVFEDFCGDFVGGGGVGEDFSGDFTGESPRGTSCTGEDFCGGGGDFIGGEEGGGVSAP